jgi:hypothetical protein
MAVAVRMHPSLVIGGLIYYMHPHPVPVRLAIRFCGLSGASTVISRRRRRPPRRRMS